MIALTNKYESYVTCGKRSQSNSHLQHGTTTNEVDNEIFRLKRMTNAINNGTKLVFIVVLLN